MLHAKRPHIFYSFSAIRVPPSDNGLKVPTTHPPLNVLDVWLMAPFILPSAPAQAWIIALDMSRLETDQDGSKHGEQLSAAAQRLLHKFEVTLIAVAALLTRPFAPALGLIDQLLIEKHRRFF